ncbi:putative addiction module antidote protein, CopG/Arc/MetJ family [Gloeothece citriformis PCC 7424]|uniref:Putative addiction module antidote protein, CopG/Arc/MetJ family n=2 Tax=Gloeothece TaxID=28070 RepID=B7KCQ5_GLOC7|nr:putative addiction module antidote protein, CopG/Arc/MetJ family [Gloeothece citriformis PCC 7424]
MKNINISLPESIQNYVEEQVAKGKYSSISEYFCDLIRQEQKQKAQERLEDLLVEGLESGEATEMTQKDWQEIRQGIQQNLENKKKI